MVAARAAGVPAGEAEIAAELARESLAGGELPLATFRAVLGGFTDVDQPELRGRTRRG